MKICGLVLLWGIAITCGGQTNAVHHRFRFFLEPELAAPYTTGELRSRLALYVEDLNTIFSKNTIRRFDFDPATDVTVTNDLDRFHGHYPGDLPEGGNYEVWAMANYAPSYPSHGGHMSFATNGAGVSAGMSWAAIHNRKELASAPAGDEQLRDYVIQLLTVAHEMAHVFGAGSGEYYSLSVMSDTTGVAPVQNVQFAPWDPGTDPYWSQHLDYWTDPLLTFTFDLTHAEVLRRVLFAHVTSAMINAGFRNVFPLSRYLPNLAATRVWLFSGGPENPIVNATVRVWLVSQRTDIAREIFSGTSDASGRVQVGWEGEPNNEANTILIKAYPPSGEAKARWYSVYEAQEQKVLFGREELNIYMNLAATNPGPVVNVNRFGENGVEVQWPASAVDYVLEQTRDLKLPDWQFVNRAAQTNGSRYVVTFPASEANRFFRLRKP